MMTTRLSRQNEGTADKHKKKASGWFNMVSCNTKLSTLNFFGAEAHPFEWKTIVSTNRSSATTSSYFSDFTIYENKLNSWAFDLAKLMATPGIAVPFGKVPASVRTTAFFSRCGCGYVFSENCKQKGLPFPPIFEEVLSDIMPVAGVLSEDFWPNCANVTWYRNE